MPLDMDRYTATVCTVRNLHYRADLTFALAELFAVVLICVEAPELDTEDRLYRQMVTGAYRGARLITQQVARAAVRIVLP